MPHRTIRRPGPHPPGVITNPDGTADYTESMTVEDHARLCNDLRCPLIIKAFGGITEEIRETVAKYRAILDPGLAMYVHTEDRLFEV